MTELYQKPSLRPQNSWTAKIMDLLPCLMKNEATDWKTWNPEHWTVDMGKTDDWKYSQLLKFTESLLLPLSSSTPGWGSYSLMSSIPYLRSLSDKRRCCLLLKLIYSIWTQRSQHPLGSQLCSQCWEKNFLNMSHKTL